MRSISETITIHSSNLDDPLAPSLTTLSPFSSCSIETSLEDTLSTMHVLGLCNGSLRGNSEILLKVALSEIEIKHANITTSWIHVPSLIIPPNPAPLDGTIDISMGSNKSHMNGAKVSALVDDRRAALNAILDADAIIVASATYSHQPPAFLKCLMDRIGGPFLDTGFVKQALEKKANGDPKFAKFQCDERLLKPRVLGFMMTGGSTTPDQFSMALPSLQLYFYCLHAKVVDQFVGQNCMDAGSVLLKPKLVERAKLLALNVASQIGKAYDDAKFFGSSAPGACTYCHLSAIELFNDGSNGVGCISCGARGWLAVGDDGKILPRWEEDSEWSCVTMKGKLKHGEDILSWGARERGKMASIIEEKERWLNVHIAQVPLPSQDLEHVEDRVASVRL
jgi:multimeric flavodoxin WrbA